MPSPTLEPVRFGQFVLVDTTASPLPLEKTGVNCSITGPLATVSVTQHFHNPLSDPVELEYLFPLPESAAVFDFEIHVDQRVIRASIDEIEHARQIYQDARVRGQRAALLEQRRSNLFALRVANVIPGSRIFTVLRYQERVKFDNGDYEFVFPMGITPRYHRPDAGQEASGVDFPVALPGEKIGPVTLHVSVDAGCPSEQISSPSHAITTFRLDERRFRVEFSQPATPDHDFVLRYSVAKNSPLLAAWLTPGKGGDYFLVTLIPPTLDEETATPPARDFVFVLDRSGSMSGAPIAQARNALRACLRALNETDTFRIITFDHMVEPFKAHSSPVTQAEIDQADAFLEKIQGRGGTEIVGALQAALSYSSTPERTQYIVFLTDGAVSAEARVLEELRQRIGRARVFTFGIGPSVNRALLNQLARLGHGTAEFLQLDEDIEGAIIRFQDRISYPMLTDLSIEWQNANPWDLYPQSLPDLYAGQPIEMCGRVKPSAEGQPVIRVRGQVGSQVIRLEGKLTPLEDEPAIARVWARARIDDLLEKEAARSGSPSQSRAEVIGLALEHRLITPYTALVAVDSEVVTEEGRSGTIVISQPLPQGLDRGFGMTAIAAVGMAPPQPRQIGQPSSVDFIDRMINTSAPVPKSASYRDEQFSRQSDRDIPLPHEKEQALRALMRSQKINGSWDNDIEMSAAVLLSLLHQGYTSHKGHFRRQIHTALTWLSAQTPSSSLEAYLQAFTLREMASAAGHEKMLEKAHDRIAHLPQPSGQVETFLAGLLQGQDSGSEWVGRPVHTFDDLRMAGAAGAPIPASAVHPDLMRGERASLAGAWRAALREPQSV